jgi:hypothetical protein
LYYYRELLFIGKITDKDLDNKIEKGVLQEGEVVELIDTYQCLMVHTQTSEGMMIGFRFIKLGIIQITDEGVVVKLDTNSPFYEQYLHENSGIVSGSVISSVKNQKAH